MKVAIIYNKDMTGVINTFGMQNKERYDPSVVNKVANALEFNGHNVEIIDGNMHLVENLQNFMPKVMKGERLGMVFNMAYGIQGESRYTHIPAMLEMLGIPYVGSSPSGHALALDKVITKVIMQQHGIPTPDFWVFSSADDNMKDVRYPVIVKPKMESVSFGLRVVHNPNDLKDAVSFITAEFKQQALVEQFIRGREFAVGLLGNAPIETLPLVEFDLETPDTIQSVEDKQKSPKRKICPANIPLEMESEMKQLSIRAFEALQLKDFARVDIRVDENNNIYLLEINSMASLGLRGSYVHAALQYGYEFNGLVNKMLDVAAARYFSEDKEDDITCEDEESKPIHSRIRSYIGSKMDFAEKLLQQIVDINSYVRNLEGVNQLASIFRKHLIMLGFNYEVIRNVEIGNAVFFSNTDGTDYDFLFISNLDNDRPVHKHKYYSKTGQKIYGSGIWENKGGLVVFLLALQSLRHIRLLKRLKIGVLLTSDDSLQGKFASKIVISKSENADCIIGLKGGTLNGGVVTSRSGAAVYRCTMNLKKTNDPGLVPTASHIFSRMISQWVNLSEPGNGLLISPGEARVSSNISEAYFHGEVTLSVRFDNPKQMEIAHEKIRKTIPSKYRSNLHFQIDGGPRRPAMIHNEKVAALWNRIKQLANKMDIRLVDEHRWNSSDIGFISAAKFRIDGMGPIGVKPVNGEEYILKHSIKERASLLALGMLDFKEMMEKEKQDVMNKGEFLTN